jgi:methyl-accepting chemotaxis protein
MAVFENVKTSHKVMVLLLLMVAFAITATISSSSKMLAFDDAYSLLLTHEAKGSVTVAQMNARLIDTGHLAYLLIAEEDAQHLRAIDQELEAAAERFPKLGQDAKGRLPSSAGDIDRLVSEYDALIRNMAEIRKLAMANDNARAVSLMRERFVPAMGRLRSHVNELVDAVEKDVLRRSEEESASSAFTVRFTLGVVLAGLVIVLSLAFWLTSRHLARPIVGIGSVMSALARRDYSVEVAGAERRDEIGVMAKAILVFKNEMMKADSAEAEQRKEREAREARSHRIETMTRDFDQKVSSILGIVGNAGTEMRTTASSMSATAEQTTRQASVVA